MNLTSLQWSVPNHRRLQLTAIMISKWIGHYDFRMDRSLQPRYMMLQPASIIDIQRCYIFVLCGTHQTEWVTKLVTLLHILRFHNLSPPPPPPLGLTVSGNMASFIKQLMRKALSYITCITAGPRLQAHIWPLWLHVRVFLGVRTFKIASWCDIADCAYNHVVQYHIIFCYSCWNEHIQSCSGVWHRQISYTSHNILKPGRMFAFKYKFYYLIFFVYLTTNTKHDSTFVEMCHVPQLWVQSILQLYWVNIESITKYQYPTSIAKSTTVELWLMWCRVSQRSIMGTLTWPLL